MRNVWFEKSRGEGNKIGGEAVALISSIIFLRHQLLLINVSNIGGPDSGDSKLDKNSHQLSSTSSPLGVELCIQSD